MKVFHITGEINEQVDGAIFQWVAQAITAGETELTVTNHFLI